MRGKTLFAALTFAAAVQAQPRAYGLAQSPLNGIPNSLTIYVYPSFEPINWSTPKATINQMIKMQAEAELLLNDEIEFVSDFNEAGRMTSVYRSTMGHTIGHIRCTLPSGQLYDKWTSFTGQNYGKVDIVNLLDKKIGAGVLFANYVDGEVIEGQENQMRLTFYHGGKSSASREPNRPRYWQIEISPQACANIKDMEDFFASLHHPKMSLPDLENLPPEKRLYFSAQLDPYETYLQRKLDPQALVGGGCAPYGAALIKMAGRYLPEFETFFRRPLQVSERLIGGEIDPDTGKMRDVHLADLMLGKLGNHWTFPGYKNRFVSMYDPQLIWDFIGNLMQCARTPRRCDPAAAAWIKSQRGLSLGEREVLTHHYMAYVGPKNGPDGKPTERIPAVRSQVIDGVLWRN